MAYKIDEIGDLIRTTIDVVYRSKARVVLTRMGVPNPPKETVRKIAKALEREAVKRSRQREAEE
jgi:signal recognition particle subunit SEC65